MLERLLIAAIVIGAVALAIALTRLLFALHDCRTITRIRAAHPSQPHQSSSTPKLIYFTTTSCVVCKVHQQPAIEELLEQLPELEIDKYDAVEEHELADRYGVLSVPTTAVYDRDGQLVSINRGFAPAAVLYAQVTGAEVMMDGGQDMSAERIESPLK
jgi:thiol-disulfide isomerase/thioredoxin